MGTSSFINNEFIIEPVKKQNFLLLKIAFTKKIRKLPDEKEKSMSFHLLKVFPFLE
jgi:hypothetical protein